MAAPRGGGQWQFPQPARDSILRFVRILWEKYDTEHFWAHLRIASTRDWWLWWVKLIRCLLKSHRRLLRAAPATVWQSSYKCDWGIKGEMHPWAWFSASGTGSFFPRLSPGLCPRTPLGTRIRALVSSYRPSVVTCPLSLRVSETLPLLCSSTPLFPTHL